MASARVEILSGPLAGSTVPLTGASLAIGREAGNDLVLEDSTVSRRHALIVPDASGAVIRDLGSRNGIAIEGASTREGRLTHGARFSVGRIACRYLSEADAPATQAAPAPKPSPPAPAPVPAAPAPSAAPGKAFDWRFTAFLGAALVVVAAVLFAWYRNAHRVPDTVEKDVLMKEGEEKYQPDRPFTKPDIDDKGAILEIIKSYPSAIAFRARSTGDASITLPHEDGTRTVLKIAVRGVKTALPSIELPPDMDRTRLQEFCEGKLAEAKALAGDGKLRPAFLIAQGVVGQYRDVMPKPPVATEARNQAGKWEQQIEEKLNELEITLRDKSDKHDYDGVDAVLWQMRDLVEPDSAAYQRLKFIREMNLKARQDSQPKEAR